MRRLLTTLLISSVITTSAFADGPSVEIKVTSPGHIYQYILHNGDKVSVYPIAAQKVSGYVYALDTWFYNSNTPGPITLQPPEKNGFTMPAAATHFPFQIIIQSCGTAPTSTMWSITHPRSILNISAYNALKSTCSNGVGHDGAGLISITPIDG